MKDKGKLEPLAPVTSAVLMRVLGCSKSQLYRLVNDGTIPRASKNRFDLVKAVPAYLDYVRRGSGAAESAHAQRLRLAEAQTKAIEQRIRQRDGELVEIAAVARVFDGVMVTLAAQLDGIAGRCAAEIAAMTDPAQARAKLLEEARRVRANAADELERFANRGAGRKALAAAAEANGRRVG